MMPPDPQSTVSPPAQSVSVPEARPAFHWYHALSAFCFILGCLGIGFYLLFYPWSASWESNYFSYLLPHVRNYWNNLYVRGAVSGLGAINVYVSLVEIFRLRRFARR
jgi:hypothetical protein